MGLWDRVARKLKARSEADAVFSKLSQFLNSDSAQNAAMSEDIRPMLEVGGSIDTYPNASGEFGLSVSNPIPVNGPVGEVTYLSSLKLVDGRGIWAHRLGSKGRVDVFEAVSNDGNDWFLLYFSPYHPRKSALCPRGFHFEQAPRVKGIYATNQHVANFPHDLYDAIIDWSKSTLGIPLVSPNLRSAIQSTSFLRPTRHVVAVDALQLQGSDATIGREQHLLLKDFTYDNLMTPFVSVLKHHIGYEQLDASEISIFCAAMTTYCYLRYGPKQPDENMLETFHMSIVEDIVTGSLPVPDAVRLYQVRYLEYSALIGPIFDPEKDQRHHMTTLMMHACERASHSTAKGRMINIAINSSVIAALLDDTFKFVRSSLAKAVL